MIYGKSEVVESLKNIRNLPTVPQVMLELSNLLRNDSHTQHDITKLIGKDQSLTTKLLSIANSPLFGLPRKVASIDLAVMLIGEEELSNIVIALSMLEAIKFDSESNFEYMDYWKHSMIVAAVSKNIANQVGMKDLSSDAFVAGMLHDLGIQILVKYFKKEYEEIYNKFRNENISFFEAENAIIGCSHQDIGEFLLQKWSFPESMCDVLADHHTPLKNSEPNKVGCIVNLSDFIIDKHQMGNVFWDEGTKIDEKILPVLGFSDEDSLNNFINDYEETLIEQVGSLSLL